MVLDGSSKQATEGLNAPDGATVPKQEPVPETTPTITSTPADDHVPEHMQSSIESIRPALPPRPGSRAPTLTPRKSSRPLLLSKPTTALSQTDVHSHAFQPVGPEGPSRSSTTPQSIRIRSRQASSQALPADDPDNSSLASYAPTASYGYAESLLGDVLAASRQRRDVSDDAEASQHPSSPLDLLSANDDEVYGEFEHEFDDLSELHASGENEEQLLLEWRQRQKQFIVLSAAGKPIYSRHGDDNLMSGYIGVVQTIMSFHEEQDDPLRCFEAGGARFVILTKGPLYLVAISKLGESELQLRGQLESLYMQILSTLTLPRITQLFKSRASTDLRRPLAGTENLLSALVDSFTRGSPSSLLASLECLRLRKRDRQAIADSMLSAKSPNLLYGLIVASGRLVSVIRPRTHSLHPGDMQLIFNMLFDAGVVKAGGGDSWIPICLPGFNTDGYLYMYVGFLDEDEHASEDSAPTIDRMAVVLISAKRESFYELKEMRDGMVKDLAKKNLLNTVKNAVAKGRPSTVDIVPGTVLSHFLYKSKGNLQYCMPSYLPNYPTVLAQRRLHSVYQNLHANIHAKNAHLKVYHCISQQAISLAWVTPVFELYCVADPSASRNALTQGANKLIQWIRKEEERLFIIGGAVF